MSIAGGGLDASAYPLAIANLTLSGGSLMLGIGNPLTCSGTAALGGGTVSLSGAAGLGLYPLVVGTPGGSLGSTFVDIPANYRVAARAAKVDLVHLAALGTITATPFAAAIITGGTTAVSFTVQNSAPAGSDNLSVSSVAPGANLGGGAAGLPLSVPAASSSSPIGGLIFNGTALGPGQTGSFTVNGGSGTVSVNVLDHSNASLSPTASQTSQLLDFGNVLRGATVPSQNFTIYNRAANTTAAGTANLQLTAFAASGDAALATNLAPFSGLAATSGTTCTASLNTSQYTTTGVSVITMSASQLADDSTLPGAGGNNAGALTVTIRGNVGNAAANAGNSQTAFGTVLTAPVAAGAAYANLESTVKSTTGSGGSGMIGSTATILAGTNSSALAQTVSMSWRTQTQAERSGSGLASDVVCLTGMAFNGGSGQTSPFVLQMDYDPDFLHGDESLLASEGMVLLEWLNPVSGQWENAIDGNFGSNTGGFRLGAWQPGDMTLGDWGVNTTSHVVWAVLDHNSDFAVVPEPSTCVLVGASVIGLAARAWRRRSKRRTSASLTPEATCSDENDAPATLALPSRSLRTEARRRAA